MTHKLEKSHIEQKFIRFLNHQIKDAKKFESPMALFEWLVREWHRPLKGMALQKAYLAAWAFSIDRGLVEL